MFAASTLSLNLKDVQGSNFEVSVNNIRTQYENLYFISVDLSFMPLGNLS